MFLVFWGVFHVFSLFLTTFSRKYVFFAKNISNRGANRSDSDPGHFFTPKNDLCDPFGEVGGQGLRPTGLLRGVNSI